LKKTRKKTSLLEENDSGYEIGDIKIFTVGTDGRAKSVPRSQLDTLLERLTSSSFVSVSNQQDLDDDSPKEDMYSNPSEDGKESRAESGKNYRGEQGFPNR